MATDQANDSFIQSNEPANNGYGQNGFQGPSSDLPGQHTTSGFLPQSAVPKSDWQTRSVSKEQYAPAHSMRNRNANPLTIPAKTHRP